MSVGFEVPGDVVEQVDFQSGMSLLDADVIIFAPNLSHYDAREHYAGKRCVSQHDSARLEDDAGHWHRELRIALQAGKTVFVMMLGVEDVYIYTGRQNVSGTGRNARVTNIVNLFNPYSASIPVPGLGESVQRRVGERIKTTQHIGILAPYWQQFEPVTYYHIYLEKDVGTPALVTQTGDKMVGGVVRFKDWKGVVVLLPPPGLSYIVTERVKQNSQRRGKGKKTRVVSEKAEGRSLIRARKSVGEQFVGALVEIDKALRMRSEKTPTPAWANVQEFALAEEERVKLHLTEIDGRIADLQKQKLETEANLDSAGNLKGLLFETGKPLEAAILEALRILRFAAEGFSDDESEFDAVFIDPSGARLLGEAEGKNDKAVNIEKLDQLERNVQEDFKKREDSTQYAKGVLFGNAFRLLPPAERGDYF